MCYESAIINIFEDMKETNGDFVVCMCIPCAFIHDIVFCSCILYDCYFYQDEIDI